MPEKSWFIGLMSGTSMDGIDAAVLETDGESIGRFGAALTIPYEEAMRARLRAALNPAPHSPALRGLAGAVAEAHAGAVAALLREAGMRPGEIAGIGFHGHTLLHRPREGRTWQIGDAALLGRRTGISVISDFRAQDVAMGGQGAPLVPLYHAALARRGDIAPPLLVLNLGGVGNLTYIGAGDEELVAFDTGPGNALIDDWVRARTGAALDEGGALASRGQVDAEALARLLDHPYFAAPPPKSLDRDDFGLEAVAHLGTEDGAATLAAFTAAAAARGLGHTGPRPLRCLVTGGGRHNAALMRHLGQQLNMAVEPVEALGWRGDALEAEAFAFLAARARRGLPLSLPGTTGVARAMPGGRLHWS